MQADAIDMRAIDAIALPWTTKKLSRVALGTWAIGGWMWGGADDDASIATIRAALDRGVNVIDTAPVYGFGHAEEVVGRALAGVPRESVVIATKVALEWSSGKPRRDASRDRIMREIEQSLRRLRVDYIDVYQVHWPDPKTPMQETAEAMSDLFARGVIRSIGVSNFSVAQMEEFQRYAPLHVLQSPYNLFEREIDAKILPYCLEHDIATLGYGALCRGLLSGRMRPDTQFSGDDLRRNDPKFQPERYPDYLAAVAKLDDFARERYGKKVIDLAVRWVLDRGVSVALWGARRPDQVANVGAVSGWSLDDAAMARIDQILHETIKHPVGPEFMAPPS